MISKNQITITRLLLALTLAGVLLLGSAGVVQAAEIKGDGVLAAGQVVDDDLILYGETVVVDGTVNGMLIATGQTVTVNGTVNGDAFLFGNMVIVSETARIDGNLFSGSASIEVRGEVTGSLAGGSATLTLADGAAVGRNLYYGGYSFEAMPKTTLGKDLFAAVYQAILNGEVERDVNIGGAAVELNGKVGRNASFDVEAPGGEMPMMPMYFGPNMPKMPPAISPGLRISGLAEIGGKLTYTSAVDQSAAIQAAPAGGIVFQTPQPSVTEQKEVKPVAPRVSYALGVLNWFAKILRNLITLLILGGLALWLIPAIFEQTVQQARSQPLPAAGYGLITILVGYLAALFIAAVIIAFGLFFCVVTLGGLSRTIFGVGFSSLALVVTLFTLLVSYGSKVVVSYLGGRWILQRLAPQAGNPRLWALLIGVFIYVLLRAIPFLGWLIGLIATVIGIGAMWFVYRNWRKPAAEITAQSETAAL